MRDAPLHRSFLYAPGSNERIMGKVLDAGADAVILDLEDAVAETDKDAARDAVAALVAERAAGAACAVHVRINRDGDGFSEADVRAVVHPGLAALRLPKCETAAPIAALDPLLAVLERERGLEPGAIGLYPTVESAAGVVAAAELARASARVTALAFGPADFLADLGIMRSDQVESTLLARSSLVLQSRAAGIGPPVDGAFTDLGDLAGLRRLTEWVRDLGFAGKSAIHPSQLAVLHEVFTPSAEDVRCAREVIAGLAEDGGTAVVEGSFVDPAVVAQARAVVDLAERIGARGFSSD